MILSVMMMKKFLPFSKRQPSLDNFSISRGGFNASNRSNGKLRRISATSLNSKSIQVVRGAYNIDLNKVDSKFTKLHKACLLNDESQVKRQLQKIDTNSYDSSHRYPLHLACVNGNLAIVELLIDNNANPNVQDNDGNTPLIKSIESGHEHLVKYLLSNGADPNIPDSDHNTALHWAFMTESMIAIDALMSSQKCDLSLRNNKDETCLHIAVRCPLINTFTYQTLIEGGSDIDAKDQLRLTPIEIAQACDNKRALEALERCRTNKNDLTGLRTINFVDDEDEFREPAMNARKLCEEYKVKYLAKNRENLEYEKKLIQLNAHLERLKVDMTDLKEQNAKLDTDNAKLVAELYELKNDNSNLKQAINKMKSMGPKVSEARKETKTNVTANNYGSSPMKAENHDKSYLNAIDCEEHKKFLTAKALLQDRINQLRYELTMRNQ